VELTPEITAGLRRVRRRQCVFVLTWIAYVPVLAVLVLQLRIPPELVMPVGLTWMAIMAAAAAWTVRARCPRCGEHFGVERTLRIAGWLDPVAGRCRSCQLPLR
jgi:hypothetical protein